MTVVGIDVETTSLDPKTGDIIEVACIRYDLSSRQELDRFTSLIRPRKSSIPSIVTSITGITNEMVADKPSFTQIVPHLQAFIQPTDILVGHNVSFDVSFLQHAGLPLKNMVWDTFLLATSAYPQAESYNLGMLAKMIGIPSGTEHRATDDVLLTFQVLFAMAEQLAASQQTADIIADLLQKNGLGHYLPLFSVRSTPNTPPRISHPLAPAPVFSYTDAPLKNQISDLLKAGGFLEKTLPGFVSRPAQESMASMVLETIENKEKAFLEAPTGTGKTLGYLVPALAFLEKNPDTKPIIISTYTRTLQDQLSSRDLPRLLSALGSRKRYALLKGRRNYLCTTTLNQDLGKPHSPDEVWMLIKVLLWLEQGGSGDIEQLKTTHQGDQYLKTLTADSLTCRFACTDSACPYTQALERARSADIVVINHALLAQRALGEDTSLPFHHLIIDEAHHLPSALRSGLEHDLSYSALDHRMVGLVQSLKSLHDTSWRLLRREMEYIPDAYTTFHEAIHTFYTTHRGDKKTLRLTPSMRRNTAWKTIEKASDVLVSKLRLIQGLGSSMLSLFSTEKDGYMLKQSLQDLEQWVVQFQAYVSGDTTRVQWIEEKMATHFSLVPDIQLRDAPLSIATILAPFFERIDSVCCTSATLSTGTNFSYIKALLGLPAAKELRIASSPFTYKSQMLLYIVEDSPHPTSTDFERTLSRLIYDVSTLLGGKTLVLLTSHRAVKSLYNMLNKSLYKEAINLYAQKITGGRNSIIERFLHKQPAVLLGTSSFWEGIDMPGETLSCVIIPKLPFATPDDPITEAIAEADNKDGFTHLSVPHMILRLRQGIGRLIRTSTDKGVVILTDPRFLKFEYGSQVLKSLPPATITIGPRHELIPTMTDWFGESVVKNWQKKRPDSIVEK